MHQGQADVLASFGRTVVHEGRSLSGKECLAPQCWAARHHTTRGLCHAVQGNHEHDVCGAGILKIGMMASVGWS